MNTSLLQNIEVGICGLGNTRKIYSTVTYLNYLLFGGQGAVVKDDGDGRRPQGIIEWYNPDHGGHHLEPSFFLLSNDVELHQGDGGFLFAVGNKYTLNSLLDNVVGRNILATVHK